MATTKKAPAKKVAKKAPSAKVASAVVIQRHDRFDWRSLYLYAVCLITLMVCLFSIVSLVRNGISAIFPDPVYIDPYNTVKPSVVESALIAKQTHDQNQHRAIMSLVDSVTTLLIAGPLYLYHWKMVRKES